MKKESFKQGITDGIPIALGYLAVSFTFGMMAVQGGLTIWQAVLISLTNLTSAGQFAGHYQSRRISVGDGTDSADHQFEILPDVLLSFPEAAQG